MCLPWLRGPKAQRLLDEVLAADGPTYPRTFDLLILDEAHHVAPAAPKQVYAVDSQQTKLIRRLAPHFTHRLFLSATPHNGYQASFTALLEILDDQRFARGVDPDRDAVKRRRRTPAEARHRGRRRHAAVRQPGDTRPIPVDYPEDERQIHGLLTEFADAAPAGALNQTRGRKAADLVTLLLKKRLFSSPAAFAHTVAVYPETLERPRRRPLPRAEDECRLDGRLLRRDRDLRRRGARPRPRTTRSTASSRCSPRPSAEQRGRRSRCCGGWRVGADAHEAEPDAKARELINYLRRSAARTARLDERARRRLHRVPRHPALARASCCASEGIGEPRLAQLHGGMAADEREQLRLAFQADPTEHPVRILLATDAASEGIDLQNHCHRLVNYDIPFNPNQLEQRIGRIDRYGQRDSARDPALRRHRLGARAVDAFEADLEFLARVATQGRADAGGPRLGQRGPRRRRPASDARRDRRLRRRRARAPAKGPDRAGRHRRPPSRCVRLRATLDKTVAELGITPAAGSSASSTPPSSSPGSSRCGRTRTTGATTSGSTTSPPLTGSWERATAGLTEKLEPGDRPPRQRPVTFDRGGGRAATTSCSPTSTTRWSRCRPGCCARRSPTPRSGCTG